MQVLLSSIPASAAEAKPCMRQAFAVAAEVAAGTRHQQLLHAKESIHNNGVEGTSVLSRFDNFLR